MRYGHWILLLGLLLGSAQASLAAQMCTFVWINPTAYTDGRPAPDGSMMATRIYRQATPPVRVAEVASPATQAPPLPCAAGEKWYATAVSREGLESVPSEVITIPSALEAPGGFRMQMTITVDVH